MAKKTKTNPDLLKLENEFAVKKSPFKIEEIKEKPKMTKIGKADIVEKVDKFLKNSKDKKVKKAKPKIDHEQDEDEQKEVLEEEEDEKEKIVDRDDQDEEDDEEKKKEEDDKAEDLKTVEMDLVIFKNDVNFFVDDAELQNNFFDQKARAETEKNWPKNSMKIIETMSKTYRHFKKQPMRRSKFTGIRKNFKPNKKKTNN